MTPWSQWKRRGGGRWGYSCGRVLVQRDSRRKSCELLLPEREVEHLYIRGGVCDDKVAASGSKGQSRRRASGSKVSSSSSPSAK